MYYLRENYSFRDDLRRGLLPALAGAIAFFCLTQVALADQASAFKQALAQGYQEISKFIDLRTHDTAGQSYFRNKSDRARALYDVDPEWPTNWTISHDTQEIMMRDRRSLVT